MHEGKREHRRNHDLFSLMRQLIEIISVTSEYPQDGGWSVLLLRLLCLHATKDYVVHSTLCIIGCLIFDSFTCRMIILTRWRPKEKGWQSLLTKEVMTDLLMSYFKNHWLVIELNSIILFKINKFKFEVFLILFEILIQSVFHCLS